MSNALDMELVEQTLKGSKEAYAELFHRYKNKIINYIYKYTGDIYASQDIAQTVFINAYMKLESLKDKDKFPMWLFTIATNQIRNFVKSRKRHVNESLDREVDGVEGLSLADMLPDDRMRPDTDMEHKLMGERIKKTYEGLSPAYREVIYLCDNEDMSYEEAARVLGCDVGTIASRLNKARRKFREIYIKLKG